MRQARDAAVILRPLCRSCGEALTLEKGIVASSSYGACCASMRRQSAKEHFGLKALSIDDFDGPYVIRQARHIA